MRVNLAENQSWVVFYRPRWAAAARLKISVCITKSALISLFHHLLHLSIAEDMARLILINNPRSSQRVLMQWKAWLATHSGRSVGCGSLWNVELWTINVLLAVTFQCCCGCCLFVCLSWTELTGVLFYKICTEIFVSGDIWIVVVVVFFSLGPWHHWTTTHMSTNRDDFFILITDNQSDTRTITN